MKIQIKHIFFILIILLVCTVLLTSYRKGILHHTNAELFNDLGMCKKIKSCKKCLTTSICGWSPEEGCIPIPQNITGLILLKSKCTGKPEPEPEGTTGTQQLNNLQTGAPVQGDGSNQDVSDSANVISGSGPSAASVIKYSAGVSDYISALYYQQAEKSFVPIPTPPPSLKTEGGLPPIIKTAAKQRELVHPSSKR
jgi:hypothetical protein